MHALCFTPSPRLPSRSPDHFHSADNTLNVGTPPHGSVGGASSLPDLTSIEFSSGLDVPLDGEEPMNEQPPLQPSAFHSPAMVAAGGGPGLSKLLYATHPALEPRPLPTPSSPLTQWRAPPLYYSSPSMSGVTNGPVYHMARPHLDSQSFANHRPQPLQPFIPDSVGGGGVRKSPTMPDFRSLSSGGSAGSGFARPPQYTNPTPGYKHILPASTPGTPNHALPPYRTSSAGLPGSFSHSFPLPGQQLPPVLHAPPPGLHAVPPGQQAPPPSQRGPAPMTIIIQPPVTSVPLSPTLPPLSTLSPQVESPGARQLPPLAPVLNSPTRATFSVSSSGLGGAVGSAPNTPTITLSSALPSYIEARQQQALQQKFASFNVKNEVVLRSHSEENLQKAQKERGGDLLHNPFMGNLANANSVPCVYVETPNMELPAERADSPPPGADSPSTSASYASSPPSVRPHWIDHPSEFVYNEWPLQERGRQGSPPHHHKSLTDLSTIPEGSELSPSNRSRSLLHQFCLPPIAMGDLGLVEPLDKQQDPFIHADFELEDEDAMMMDSLLKDEAVVGMGFENDIGGLLGSDSLMPGASDSVPLTTSNHHLQY